MAEEQPRVDAREAVGVQVGEGNTQIIYSYARSTWTDAPAPPPLVTVSGAVVSPYRGLNSFDERDAAFFFGRESAITALLDRMAEATDPALLMVSGVSGAGKSSLLQAGILPRVRGEGLAGRPEAATWPSMVVTPTASPMAELAVAFAGAAHLDPGGLRRSLTAEPADLRLVAQQVAAGDQASESFARAPGGRRVLLIVDQFEQLFTQCRNEAERRVFVAALHAAASRSGAGEPAILLVIGIRADYEARCADYPELADAVDRRFLVRAMTERQLRMAITEPARMAGGEIDEQVVQAVLGELTANRVGGSDGTFAQSTAGALPLLSHALDQAWRMRTHQTVTLAEYERTGGIERAIGRSAQQVYESLTVEQQLAARQVFTRLTVTDPDGADSADRVARQELVDQSANPGEVQTVLEAFAKERLLVLDADAVAISHESLLSAWPLLRNDWLAQSRADRIIRTRVANAATEWDRHDRDAAYLYTGSVLDVATAAQTRITVDPRQPGLGPLESAFLDASAAAQTRRRRRQRAVLGVLALLLVAVGTSAVFALQQSQRATSQSRTATAQRDLAISRQLISESEDASGNPLDARLESLAAWRIDPSHDARYAMLSAAARPELAEMPGHTGLVRSVAFSPDGKTMASGSFDNTVRLWNAVTHQQIGAPLRNGAAVLSVAFGPDGETLATGGYAGAVRLWDVATHRQIGARLALHTGIVTSVAFGADGKTLVTGGDDVRLWDVATHRQIGAPVTGAVESVAFSPDGETLATGAADRTVRLWEVATHRQIGAPLAGHTDIVNSVAFSPDGKTLASGAVDNTVRLWDVATHRKIGSPLAGHVGDVNSVAFSSDGKTLASASADGTVRLWDVAAEQEIGAPLEVRGGGGVRTVAFSKDDKFLGTDSGGNAVGLWDLTTHRQIGALLAGRPYAVESVAFSPDGKTVASGNYDKTVRMWSLATHRQIGAPLRNSAAVLSVAFSPDGKMLASGSTDGTVRLWSLATHGEIGAPLIGHTDNVYSVAFSPDGKMLASGSTDGTVRLWSVSTGRQIGATLAVSFGNGRSIAFSPDGKILASGTYDTVRLWNVATHKQIGTPLSGHISSVVSVAFSRDGKTLASGSDDTTVRLWSLATHKQIGAPLIGHISSVSSLAFSPDGKTLASGSDDYTTRLWDVATHRLIGAPLIGHTDRVNSIAFNPDGKTLASGSDDSAVRLWDVAELSDPAAFLCKTVGRPMTRDEWHRLVPVGPRFRPVCP